MRERAYFNDVNKTVSKMKAYFLGQNEKLCTVLPEHLKSVSNETKAAYLAQRLLFCLSTVVYEHRKEKLQRCFNWLYSIILFLFEKCPEEDHTFISITHISGLDIETRRVMFEDDKYRPLRIEESQPKMMWGYELAVLYLLNAAHRIKSNECKLIFIKKKYCN